MTTVVSCPACGSQIEWGLQSPDRPFCSERCKLIDLGGWVGEPPTIAGDLVVDDFFSNEILGSNH